MWVLLIYLFFEGFDVCHFHFHVYYIQCFNNVHKHVHAVLVLLISFLKALIFVISHFHA